MAENKSNNTFSSSAPFGLHSGFFHHVLREIQQIQTQVTSVNLMYPIFIS